MDLDREKLKLLSPPLLSAGQVRLCVIHTVLFDQSWCRFEAEQPYMRSGGRGGDIFV